MNFEQRSETMNFEQRSETMNFEQRSEIAQKYLDDGYKFLEKHDLDKAIRCFIKGSVISPQDPTFFIILGNCFMSQKKLDFGIVNFKKALTIWPENFLYRMSVIKALMVAEKYKEAYFYRHEIKIDFGPLKLLSLETSHRIKADYAQIDHILNMKKLGLR